VAAPQPVSMAPRSCGSAAYGATYQYLWHFSRRARKGIIARMPHAFRIGPLDGPGGPSFIYAAFHPSGEAEATQASDDVTGLRMLSEAFSGHELVVEPELGRAGKELGLRRARLPAEVAQANPHWRHTLIGTATIDDRALVVEASSLARIDALRARIEEALGPRIAHRERKRMPLGDVPVGIGEGPLQIDAMASLGIWHKPAEIVVREHARRLLEEPNDALGGLPPRAAAAKASSRRALHQWLKELEHAEARSNVPGASTYMREALDLSPTGERVRPDQETRRTGRGRKASETLVDFAAPLLEDLRDPAAARPRLELAAMVWNADALERLLGKQDTSKAMKEIEARAGLGELSPWIERLRARRRAFAEDERIIDVLEVRWEDGDLRLKALARIGPPMSKPREKPKGQRRLFE
jgi:hypothetical protein